MKKTNKKNIVSQSLHFDALKTLTSEYLKNNSRNAFTPGQILHAVHSNNSMDEMNQVLQRLIQSRKVYDHKDGRYQHGKGPDGHPYKEKHPKQVNTAGTIEGRLEVIRSGAGYLISDQSAVDVYIPEKFLNGAIHGDIVRINVIASQRRKPEGKVTEIIRRETNFFVGTFYKKKTTCFVIPSSLNHRFEIHISIADSLEAKEGDKVIVEITNWRDGSHRFPKGKVTQIMNAESLIENEMKAILINNGFALEFSPDAMAIANEVAGSMKDGLSWPERRDFRSVTTFTIDPETAKDFDDALSFAHLPNGHLEIGVHIADASHYLQEGTALDHEAYAKSTSVYLVDRALPMLPDILSGDVCSLKPLTDRLTFSVLFTIDPVKSKIVDTWIGKSVIHSNYRFTYEDAQEVLDTKKGPFFDELNQINLLAKHFRKKRFEHGSIGFDSPEYKFKLDPLTGKPLSLHLKEHIDTHALIEEFMLLANKAVAEFIHQKEKNQDSIPFVYRVHDLPDLDKLNDLASFAKELGFQMNLNTPKEIAKSLNRLYEESMKNDALKVLQPLGIRSMAKAEYTTNNIGHYGLAFELYAHFTSPIRRYSDILAHRILFQNLNDTFRVNKKRLEEQCKHISNQERKAMDAERESIKYFQLLFIQDHIGDEFVGFVSGMIEKGLFIELEENHVEGFIPFEEMPETFYLADNRLKALGRKSGMVIAMGDRLKVKVASADLDLKRVQLAFIDKV
ncbi:MAG: ribonuclease R [Saprospiraceae bacterium]